MEHIQEKVTRVIDSLKNGDSAILDELRFEIEEKGILSVCGWSNYINFENLTKGQSIGELQMVKDKFYELIAVSTQLDNFVRDYKIEFQLLFDDAGKVSILICRERNGIIQWETELKP